MPNNTVNIKEMHELLNPEAAPAQQVKELFYPKTHEAAVVDSDGNTLENKLAAINKDVAEAIEAGVEEINGIIDAAEDSLADIVSNTAIRTDVAQTLTDSEKAQAMANMGVDEELALGAVYDVSAKHPTAGPDSDGKFTLEYVLSNADTLIPSGVRKGGMSIKFVQSSDNKYVQFRYMGTSTAVAYFTNVDNWQGVDSELIDGSKNLPESSAVISYLKECYGTVKVSVPTTSVVPPSGETATRFNALAYQFKNGQAYNVEIVNNSNFLCKIYLASAVGGSENIVQDIDVVNANSSKTISFLCSSDNANYIWFRYQSDIDETLVYSFDAVINKLFGNKFKTGQFIRTVGIDTNITHESEELAKSGDVANRGLTGFPLVSITSSIGESGVTAAGQYYFNTTTKKVVYIKNYDNLSNPETVNITPVDRTLYVVGAELYVYDAAQEMMIPCSDDAPTVNSKKAAKSDAVARSLRLLGGIGFDEADYTLIKNTSSGTTTEDADGTRLRCIFFFTEKLHIDINSSYPFICNIYGKDELTKAILSGANYIESITGTAYQTGKHSYDVNTECGLLSLSFRKTNDSVISQADKETIISNVELQIYKNTELLQEIKEEIAANEVEIEGLKEGVTKIDKALSVNTLTYSDIIINIKDDVVSHIKEVSTEDTIHIIGKNLLDKSTLVKYKIKNDNGVEISDSSSYFSQMIPCHGKTIRSNYVMQRVYKYDATGAFLGREASSAERTSYVVPSNVYFVQIQIGSGSAAFNDMCVIIDNGVDDTSYVAYKEYSKVPLNGTINIFGDGISSVSVNANIYCKAIIPAVGEYAFWEPAEVTDAYKCTHRGQDTQSIPGLNYDSFLNTYFNVYLGNYDDGYSVTKEELGLDSGAQVEQSECPIFSYTFSPKYYNKTVLLSAGMNTCEASGYFGLAYFVKALMEHTEDGMLALYNSTRFIIMPVMCPTGISHDPLLYRNANNVRINKNFSYNHSWHTIYEQGGQHPGAYPDSEVETKILKAWLNRYAGADFYMDCHSDTGGVASQATSLTFCICSDTETKTKLGYRQNAIKQFYQDKGYIPSGVTPSMVFTNEGGDYPKTRYSKNICRIPAMMHEQYIISTLYGSDGNTNNDDYGIKNYCALIRWYVLNMCKSDIEFVFD